MIQTADIGLIGLGVMGENLALNIESRGFSVTGYDIDEKKRASFEQRAEGKQAVVAASLAEFVVRLKTPRKILVMVPAGKPVDAVINTIRPLLTEGDVLMDGGNSFFADTERRIRSFEGTGVHYIGTGVSGGEEGALRGPSIMPGGDEQGWPIVRPILQAIAARTEGGEICCDWIGSGGAGHFVKMVHNGIEYGDMQMIAEAYWLMELLLGMSTDEMADVFTEWNKGVLSSYLIDITAKILRTKDERTGKPMVHMILDTAAQKGTGKWTSQVALDLGIPVQTMAKAVFVRMISAIKDERVEASKVLSGPTVSFTGDKAAFLDKLRDALYCSKICSYAEGFQLMRVASEEYGWNLHYGTIAMLWRAGCIIRAQFLGSIKDAFVKRPTLMNLLLDRYFAETVMKGQQAWRQVIATAVENGIPVPAMMSALSYFDCYRSERLPANLVQAQRDFFGAHQYERIDEPRGKFFHTNWTM